MRLFEKGPGFKSGLKDLPKNLNARTMSAGIVSTIFGCTGPCLVVIAAAEAAGFTLADTVSWVFGIYVFGGLLGAILATYYKMPISGAYSIPGATLMGAALAGFTFNQAAFAFIIAGVIVLIIGITGLIGKIMKFLPLEIVMAMVAGAMMKFGTGIITSTKADWITCGAALLAFFLVPKVLKKFPGVLAALIVGVAVAAIRGQFTGDLGTIEWVGPHFVVPQFSGKLILSCSIPLAALVMGAENAQAMGVLKGEGYDVPYNGMTVASGIGGIVSGFFGAHNANIAGPMTAICCSNEAGEDKNGRYAASVFNGITFALFGVVACYAIGFVKLVPSGLVNVLAGLAMLNVLIGALSSAFTSGKFKVGAFFALCTGISGISILKIGCAFWALVIGVVVSLIMEPQDFGFGKKKEEAEEVVPEEAAE